MADVNILVVFYSRDGSVESLAREVVAGAQGKGAEVRLRRARDLVSEDVMARVPGWKERRQQMEAAYEAPSVADIEWADGVLFGTPTRFGNVSTELKAFIDSLSGAWLKGSMFNKAAGVFVSTASLHGGNETTSLTMYAPLAHLGFVIVPNGYGQGVNFAAGTPYGSSHVAGQAPEPLSDESKAVAKLQGERVTEVARALKTLRQK